MVNQNNTKMVELVDTLGLGSSSYLSKGSSPFFGNTKIKKCQRIDNYVKKKEKKKKN